MIDKNENRFDLIDYDMDGDKQFETTIDLKKIGVNACCELMYISLFTYKEFVELMREVSNYMWSNALEAIEVTEKII